MLKHINLFLSLIVLVASANVQASIALKSTINKRIAVSDTEFFTCTFGEQAEKKYCGNAISLQKKPHLAYIEASPPDIEESNDQSCVNSEENNHFGCKSQLRAKLLKTNKTLDPPTSLLDVCHPHGQTELAQLTTIFGGLILTTMDGIKVSVSPDILPERVKKFDFFTVGRVDRSKPSCEAAEIIEASPLDKKNYVFNPNAKQSYASAFVLANIKYCVLNTSEKCTKYIQGLFLSDIQIELFKTIDEKSTKTCSARTLNSIINYLDELPKHLTILVCVQHTPIGKLETPIELKLLSSKSSGFELVFSSLIDTEQ